MNESPSFAPGWPGIEPRWTSSAKSAVGIALNDGARVWFTASHGILNEVYYPEVDTACLRDAGFLITARDGFFAEEKRDCSHGVEWLEPGVPAFQLVNRCLDGRFVIEKRICSSSEFDAVLQHIRFVPLHGTLDDYTVTLLLSPHLGNHGAGNTGWTGEHKGDTLLFAQREGLSLAVACSHAFVRTTAGFAGSSDAWHDVREHGRLTKLYDRAENGNLALAAEIDLAACDGTFTIALSFGADPDTAALHARAALFNPFAETERQYIAPWLAWQDTLRSLDEDVAARHTPLYRRSVAVMKSHMSANNDGGVIASLSLPWGDSKGDGDLGGYHLVWTRDMVQTAGGLLAAGANDEMKEMLRFLAVTQEADGRWPQNMWLNGTAFWTGVQLDEAAFPILLVDLARREHAVDDDEVRLCWPMVRRAVHFIARTGPSTSQDRWEENPGYSPFTLAVAISALLSAAELADEYDESALADYLRDTADYWNANIEFWTYAEHTPLATRNDVSGYYVRIGSSALDDRANPTGGLIPVKNRSTDAPPLRAHELIATDALALVRFGLRAASDGRITNTVRVIDSMLRSETATGPTWTRYNEDGYGEHDDGRPFDGTGIGRGWPLLAGERAHYELAAGNIDEAESLAAVMRAQASDGGMLPEQVWNAEDIPDRELFNGRPAGSAMPLVWAHAEYVKLLRSLHDGHVFDHRHDVHARYVEAVNTPRATVWRIDMPAFGLRQGTVLRLDVQAPLRVRWTSDAWVTHDDVSSRPIDIGLHVVELPTATLAAGVIVQFALYWPEADHWEGQNYSLSVSVDLQTTVSGEE